ncbi:putative acetyltransferase EpsM [Paraliobacillus ryukyuensis]|uniref:Sugar O-acyltransferase (Sialic acid O-acetyltransferase NeuD family) n=1 Tax=Paraliobacillus ryukyuensis TaxID=200904 RepID=A0A366EH29_9BACI|nr:acetyltransferase [Paraliobacillus ryukyuensis]RBP00739.1 sugar O-acyltransferase (sialic acid O-acetyltransferase NeuD family) [Paraliobacillus ryukyuensis]
MKQKPVIILGNGGHATAIGELLILNDYHVLGFTNPRNEDNVYQFKYLGNDDVIINYSPQEIYLVNAIGSASDLVLRTKKYIEFSEKDYNFLSLIHPSAKVSDFADLSVGVQIMAGAIVQPFSFVGENSIINTGTIVEHECHISNHCHVAPGAVLCGGVNVGCQTFIGANSTVKQNITIGNLNTIGANSFVNKNTLDGKNYYGIPVKEVRQ